MFCNRSSKLCAEGKHIFKTAWSKSCSLFNNSVWSNSYVLLLILFYFMISLPFVSFVTHFALLHFRNITQLKQVQVAIIYPFNGKNIVLHTWRTMKVFLLLLYFLIVSCLVTWDTMYYNNVSRYSRSIICVLTVQLALAVERWTHRCPNYESTQKML